MLGSMADAEDAVQETYLRWHSADRDRVSDQRAFLMTTTTPICLDMLTSARARHEDYVGPWLPEPVVDPAALAPDSRTERAEDLSVALLLASLLALAFSWDSRPLLVVALNCRFVVAQYPLEMPSSNIR
jgi:DNA-directed RNA polymerase specialized sigma24 family protein